MLRVAVPNKGSLSETATEILKEAGYATRGDSKSLTVRDSANSVEFYFLRPKDIAVYVGSGTLDLGITGRDLMLDSGSKAVEHLQLGFGASTFRYAGRPGVASSVADLEGRRIATSFAGLVRADLEKNGVNAEVVRLDGAVETAVTLGVADVIADVVETGTTLRNAGLEVFGDPILTSEALLIRPSDRELSGQAATLVRRLEGVLTARHYVMMDYDIDAALVEEAAALTPGSESPTVSPLHDPNQVAVRVMVHRRSLNRVMDELYDLGARAILVTDIAACRL